MRLRHLPALLLAAMFVFQIGLVRLTALTPWKGGGFGMFSTLDHSAFRRLAVVVEGPDRSEAVEIPPSLERAAARAVACPADWLLRDLAAGVAERERRLEHPVSSVAVTLWRVDFARDSLAPLEHRLRSYTYRAGR
jgi:hypothetical protein